MTQKPQGYGSMCLSFSFEAAHRQPEVGGKCRNLHGHSFQVGVALFNADHIGGVNPKTGLSIDFSMVKEIVRGWLEYYFDHATLLGAADPLVRALLEEDCKLFLFGEHRRYESFDGLTTNEVQFERAYEPIEWPSVEAIAHCLGERLQEVLTSGIGAYCRVESLQVSETDTNSYMWFAPIEEGRTAVHFDGTVSGRPAE
jgi:6-pyruvoyltetrahydropterin/6-carboxytetrahydropterin synthase